MLVRVLLVVMVILMGGWPSALPVEAEGIKVKVCKMCNPGEYSPSCNVCSKCPDKYYTNITNRETSCHPCFQNCRQECHMQVVEECTSTSDVVCRCMDGYVCSERDSVTKQCKECVHVPVLTSHAPLTQTPTLTPLSPKTTNSLVQKGPARNIRMPEIWVLIVVLPATFVCVGIIQYLCRRRKKECLKKIVKQYSLGNQKGVTDTVSSRISDPIKQDHVEQVQPHTPTSTTSTSDCPIFLPASTEQPPPTAGNLGPLHIYGAGTVFVSLLNQFGQNGSEKDEEDLHQQSLNESELHCPASPLPLSTEERNRDSGYISFPSQEQGKECHMSKEEAL